MRKKEFIIVLILAVIFSSSWAKERESIPALSLGLDVPLGIFSAGTALTGLYFIKNTDIPKSLKDKSFLLPWDKPFAGVHSSTADVFSDILNGGSLIFPIAFAGVALQKDEMVAGEFWSVLAMYSEALALQSGLNLLTRSFQLWPRPHLYNSEKRKEAKGEAYGSFYSGHVSASFTSAVFSSYLFYKLFPNSSVKYWGSAVSFGVASAVAILRVAAGKHYPTDVVVGALMGSGISIGIIALHEKLNSRVSVAAGPSQVLVSFSF